MKTDNKITAVIYTGLIDSSIGIESIEYDIDDIVLFRWWYGGKWDRLHRSVIKYDATGRAYFNSYGKRWYLDEAVRTNSKWMCG